MFILYIRYLGDIFDPIVEVGHFAKTIRPETAESGRESVHSNSLEFVSFLHIQSGAYVKL